jgi:alpha-galactosidase
MHHFVNHHITRGPYANRPRPIVLNNWEATYFNFDEKTILKMAAKAKDVGVEVFVLDDGWFGKRNNDHQSLGDWVTNIKKLPHGLGGLSRSIKALGMGFGLWVEPEMVNMESDYYREHPDHAVAVKGTKPSLGRNQLHLDLTNPEVRNYLKVTLEAVFKDADVDYVKWDYNRIDPLVGTRLSQPRCLLPLIVHPLVMSIILHTKIPVFVDRRLVAIELSYESSFM